MLRSLKGKTCKAVKARFKRGDVSGDGKLDFQELSALLKKGDPTLRESEVRRLFREIDQNQDGRIDFGEFCDYVFDNQDEPSVPEEVKDAFNHFNGFNEKMSSQEFYKFCKDACLHNTHFRTSDAAIVFSKVKPKSQREIGVAEFAEALRQIADKRGCDIDEIHQALAIHSDHQENASPTWERDMNSYASAHAARKEDHAAKQRHLSVEGLRTGQLLDVWMDYSEGDVHMGRRTLTASGGGVTSVQMMHIIQEAQLLGPKLSRAEAQRLVDRELERSAERGILAFDHFSEILFQISEQLECHYSVVEDKVVALRRS